MHINANNDESNDENKKLVRPKSSINKLNLNNINNINKLIKQMDFSNIKNAKNSIDNKEKKLNYNFLKNEQKIKNFLLFGKNDNKNQIRLQLFDFDNSEKLISEDKKKIKLLEEKIKEKKKLINEKNKQIENIKENITKLKESIKEKETNIEKIKKELDDCQKSNDDLDNKINEIADELDDGELEMDQSIGMDQPNVDEMTYEQLLELEEQIGSVSNGLTEEEIKNLKHDKFIKNKYLEDKCIICQYNFIELESIVGLPCKHSFHFNCLKPWIDKQHYCPLCKCNIRKED